MSCLPCRPAFLRAEARRGVGIGIGLAAMLLALPALAIQTCDLDGQPVNPNNGATTAGKSGLLRCRDADTGLTQREQELKDGVFVGMERIFENGQVVRERRVNERGNGDGPSREWTLVDGKRVLVREDTQKNGSTVGLSRAWKRNGKIDRLTWYGETAREEASVEFNDDGKPSALRCGVRPVFGRDFDDRTACGFAGSVTTVLYDAKGRPQTRIAFDQGQRVKTEQLAPDGTIREVRELTATEQIVRSFDAAGTKRRELRFTNLPKRPDALPVAPPPSVKTLEQEYAESGRLVRERRWSLVDRGADLVEENDWYLNGQPKSEVRLVAGPQGTIRREKTFYDTGTLAFEGESVSARTRFGQGDHPTGTHRTYDEHGRKRTEQVYDDLGRLTREREFDAGGTVVRDDEVYEDGSRKAMGR